MTSDERGHVLLRPNVLRISRREREYHVPKSLESRARSGRLDACVGRALGLCFALQYDPFALRSRCRICGADVRSFDRYFGIL